MTPGSDESDTRIVRDRDNRRAKARNRKNLARGLEHGRGMIKE
jgi:hypothetical protein